MKRIIYLLIAISSISVSAQVGIGVDTAQINASAQLDVSSTTKGFLAPRMTSTQKAAIVNPASGLLVYQTDGSSGFYYYNGTAWTAVSGGTGIPYTGATAAVNLGAYDLAVNGVTIGRGAGGNEFNTVLGSNALAANTTGGGNVAIGSSTLAANTTGMGNIAIGALSLSQNTEGSSNSAVGSGSLLNNTTGYANTATGAYALLTNTTGIGNTANGSEALATNTTGSNNTAIGNYALNYNITSSNNTAIGASSLLFNEFGSGNTALGNSSLYGNVDGHNNTAIGFEADVVSSFALSNTTAIGYYAKVTQSNTIQLGNAAVTAVKTSGKLTTGTVTYPNTNGTANQVLTTDGAGNASWATAASTGIPYTGAKAAVNLGAHDLTVNGVTIGRGAAGNEYNTTIGSNALAANTIGDGNVAIGMNTLNLNTEGSGNTAIGLMSLTNNTIGVFNTAIGSFSLNTNAEGGDNTAIGSYALGNNTSGNENTSIGYNSLKLNDLGNNNTAIGNYSLSANLSGTNNTAIGYEALAFNASGSFNTALGYSADVTSQLLSNTTAIGYDAKVAASNTIQLGNAAVTAVKTSGKLTTGTVTYPNTNGTANQVLTTDGAGNATWAAAALGTSVGAISDTSNANGASITASVLNLAPANATNGGVVTTTAQTFAGAKTFSTDAVINGVTIGKGNSSSYGSTAVGVDALKVNTGVLNTAFGNGSLAANTSGQFNTAQGFSSLITNTTGNFNTAIGQSVLPSNTSGQFNTALGASAMSTNSTGSYNTTIGGASNVSQNNLTNATAIGYQATVNASNTIQLGNADVTNVTTAGTITAGVVTYPNTNGTANQVLTTDGAGNATWAAAATGTPGVDLTTNQTVGGLKTFNSNDGFLATGTFDVGNISSLGAGTRMMWYPKKAAFRVGSIDDSKWDDANIGIVSVAMGYNTTASGIAATALGYGNTASANYSTATGFETIASGINSTAMGRSNTAKSYGETVIGTFNTDYTPASTAFFNATDRLFVIGNGLNGAKSDALVMLKNGNTTFSGQIKTGTVTYPNTNGTNGQVLTTDGAGNATWATAAGGSSVTVGAVGAATINAASITAGVLSLSPADGSSPGIVTTGIQTFAGEKTFSGRVIISSNDGFVAKGKYNSGTIPATDAGTRMMWYPKKSAFRAGTVGGGEWNDGSIGLNSTAMGFSTTANGGTSTAFGFYTTASGTFSTAFGSYTTASGFSSIAMGDYTTAKSFAETVIGSYNTDYTPSSTSNFILTDRLFVIGNGLGTTYDADGYETGIDKRNALVMLKNGNTTFSGTVTAASFTSSSDKRLKRNIAPLQNSLDAIMNLKPVSYEKKNSLVSLDYSIKENGFIAQELQKIMPTLVTEGTDKDKLLSVNYIALIPVLTQAIQQQQQEIETLKALVEKLINQQK